MIYSIEGHIEHCLEDSIILSLGGLSLQVMVPRAIQFVAGTVVKLFTHLQVREDSFVLFGFETEDDILWFRTLLSIPGICAKTALNLLSSFTLDELHSIVSEEKPALLTKTTGVGAATAKKIVLFMSEKLKKKQFPVTTKKCSFPEAFEEAKHILQDLGLSLNECVDLLSEIKKEDSECKEAQTLVKEALQRRGR